MRNSAIVAAACLSMTGLAIADQAQAGIRTSTNIGAQGLAPALRLFAKERDIQLVYRSELVIDRQTSGATGELTLDEALSMLLNGTGLTYQYLDDNGITIVPVVKPPGARRTSQNDAGSIGLWDRFRLAQAEVQPGQSAIAGGAADESVRPAELEVVVVTAQKREQKLQDVPTSLVVMSGSKLEDLGITQLTDYAKVMPGLTMIGSGGPGQGQPVLRGISSGNDRNALVGLYLDDVPFTPSSPRFQGVSLSFDPALADIERVEVLKGPQSTLYGGSTMGGLIKYISKKPDVTQFDGSVLTSGSQIDGHESGYSVRLSANVPLVADRIAARGSVFYRRDPGYVDNIGRDQRDANSSSIKGGRLSVLFDITENLETTFAGFLQQTDVDALSTVFLDPATLEPLLGGLTQSTPVHEYHDFEYRLLDNTTNLDLPFATLTNILGYAKFSAFSPGDSTTLGSRFGALHTIFTHDRNSERYSDELRLASQPGRLEWMLGGFYTREKTYYPATARGADANGDLLPPTSPSLLIDTFITTATYKEYAGFGNLTYHFTDALEATVGVRHSANDQVFMTRAFGLLRTIDTGFTTDDSATSYLATVTYKPSNDLTLYARAASAYRPGGPNSLLPQAIAAGVPQSFAADTLWNYEAGIKGTVLDGLVGYSVAAYHMDWSDIQVNLTYTVPGSTQQFGYTGNAAEAASDGVEVELNVNPLEGLNVALAAAYNKTEVTDPTGLTLPGTTLGALTARKGDSLPYTPEWTASSLVDYRTGLSARVTANLGLTYAYVDTRRTGFDGFNPFRLDSYSTLDLRAALEWPKWTLTARVDNVTDEYAVTSAPASVNLTQYSSYTGSPLVGNVLRPRTFGLSFEMRF